MLKMLRVMSLRATIFKGAFVLEIELTGKDKKFLIEILEQIQNTVHTYSIKNAKLPDAPPYLLIVSALQFAYEIAFNAAAQVSQNKNSRIETNKILEKLNNLFKGASHANK